MKLTKFTIQNYRSLSHSGLVEVAQRTALVGRNESGKTNILLALESLNPPGGREPLSDTKDFPRDRQLSDFSDDLVVVKSDWQLSQEERRALSEKFPRAKGVAYVTINRHYHTTLSVGFVDIKALAVDASSMSSTQKKLFRAVAEATTEVTDEPKATISKALEELSAAVQAGSATPSDWVPGVTAATKALRAALKQAQVEVKGATQEHLTTIEQHCTDIQEDEDAHKDAQNWVASILPTFIYLDDYPELEGHQNISEYLGRKKRNALEDEDRYFEKLTKVAGLDAQQLQDLLSQDHEKRQQMANRAGAVVTKTIHNLWKDRHLKVRFNLDAQHFDTLISDPSAFYDVEINLNERSRGFRWFFSFYVTFAADTADGPAEDAILLLDEPGLHLHALAQRDLLDHFKNDFQNQILFTTHSPFMIPIEELGSVRTLSISQDAGTTVTNSPTGDARTLFPLRAALGYDLTQTLFVGEHSLVLEGVSDFWYLSSISEQFRDEGRPTLPRGLTLNPSGGAQKVPYMVAFLSSQRIKALVLLDDERLAKETQKNLVKAKLIRPEHVILISAGLAMAPQGGADIEDLIDAKTYEDLVNASYKKELSGKTLNLNPKIPRIVKRYDQAFTDFGLEFNKTRPARLFLKRMGEEPSKALTASTKQNFERLFQTITKSFEALVKADRGPFD